MDVIELFKNIAVVVGCILSCITLCGICIKPIRTAIVKKIGEWSNQKYQDEAIKKQNEAIQKQNEAIQKEDEAIQGINEKLSQIVDIISELKDRIFENEADRLRSELFDCGNRCRRDIPLSGEEFRHIQGVYKKYNEELHCNGIGEDEYKFIKDYFNSKTNQEKLNKKYDN